MSKHEHGSYKHEHHGKGMAGHKMEDHKGHEGPAHRHGEMAGHGAMAKGAKHHDHHIGGEKGESHMGSAIGELHRQAPGIRNGIEMGNQANAKEPKAHGASAGVREHPGKPAPAPKW